MDLFKDLTSFLKSAKKPLIVILGPTASGKTALSLKVAHKINGEIISTDSRQIYKGMEIGTAAIKKEEQEGVIHHMIGITTPDKTITAAEFKEMALEKIKKIYEKGKVPMLVGGTGLYISSIIDNYDMPKIPPDDILRKTLQKEADKFGAEYLHKKLEKLDPTSAERIHANNVRYVIRAIEVAMWKLQEKSAKKSVRRLCEHGSHASRERAKPLDERQISSQGKLESLFVQTSPAISTIHFDPFLIGIAHPREELYERINQRVEDQIEKGLVDEVRQLINKGYSENLPAMSSLGVKEIIPYIKGKSTLEECSETLKQNTRRYAKRQMTWFRRYDKVTWLTEKELEKILK